jgi:hypothetical protein
MLPHYDRFDEELKLSSRNNNLNCGNYIFFNWHWLSFFLEAFYVEQNGFFGISNRLFNRFTLGETARQRRNLSPIPAFISFVYQDCILQAYYLPKRAMNSSSVKPAFFIAAFSKPILKVPYLE